MVQSWSFTPKVVQIHISENWEEGEGEAQIFRDAFKFTYKVCV